MKRLLPFAIIIIVLVGAIAAGWVVLRSARDQQNTPTPTPDPAREVKGAEPPHVRGNPNAPVTLEEFGDFQCPSCGSYHPELKKIEAEFGDKLKVIFRELPLLPTHEHALMAAQAAEAAGLQGKFWEMHDLLLDNQQHLKLNHLRNYAERLQLDMPRFIADIDDHIYLQRVREHVQSGRDGGVRGTPTFFVNGRIQDVSFGMHALFEAVETALRA